MMKLTSCKFEGLEGFGDLELSDLRDLTTLAGPNGAGKSTILQVLKLAFDILSCKTLCDIPPEHEGWHRFSRASLEFHEESPATLRHFGGHFDEEAEDVVVELSLDEQQFEIRSVRRGVSTISFPDRQITETTLSRLRAESDAIGASIKELEKNLAAPQPQHGNAAHVAQQRQGWSTERDANIKTLAQKNVSIEKQMLVAAALSGGELQSVNREEVNSFIRDLNLPVVAYVDARQLYDDAIPRLINELLVQKKGRRQENAKFSETMRRLEHLLQAHVDVFEVSGKEDMCINNVQYRKASSGTQISLSFFGLTRLGEQNCIILWDEPENGLHPTRRVRLLELMFEDGRQFILATHASEFVPVFSDAGKIFRCNADYYPESGVIGLSVQHVADRRGAFAALEALGVHPARTLFTANVVIWVEGPTELVFYRHWLVPRLAIRGLREGFHYTFMQYGGALVSYLTIADDQQFESTFDLLSMCRHPILIVDSDLREAPGNRTPSEFLKKGAARLLTEVEKLNTDRRDAAIFEWTSGREVENYLPELAIWHAVSSVWQSYKDYEGALGSSDLRIGQYESFEEALEKHFDAADVVNVDKDDSTKRTAKGRSLWGAGNKIEMMRAALALPGLAEGQLKWECSSMLQRIENFVVGVSER